MHNQHAGLSETLAAQRIAERHEQAAQARLAPSAGRSRRRRRWWLARGWWWLARRPSATAQPAVRLPAGHEYQDDPPEGPSVSEFDEQFLHRHAMAWSADRRPD